MPYNGSRDLWEVLHHKDCVAGKSLPWQANCKVCGTFPSVYCVTLRPSLAFDRLYYCESCIPKAWLVEDALRNL